MGSDKTSLVGHGSWLENEGINTSTETLSEAPGPSRRHSTCRRNRTASSGRLSSTLSPLDELQNVMLSVRRQIYHTNFSDLTPNPAAAAAQAAAQQNATGNNPIFTNAFGIGHAQVRRQNLPVDPNTRPPTPAPDFDINLFVPRLEYENGRMLLMRNERAIPSLPRLVAASQVVSSTSGNNIAPLNLPSNSGIVLESVFH